VRAHKTSFGDLARGGAPGNAEVGVGQVEAVTSGRWDTSLLVRAETGLLAIDLQPALLEAMWNRDQVVANVVRLAKSARILGLPVVATEQNPLKLGPTEPRIAQALAGVTILPKMAFSCCREEQVAAALRALERRFWVICGVEAHVCVSQTAIDLRGQGSQVHVVADAVGSRTQANWHTGLDRMRQAGVVVTSTEMALFELLERAGTDEFRAVQRLVR